MRRFALLVLLASTALPAHAASQAKDNSPALLNADTVTYDDKGQTVTAAGHVTLSNKGSIVSADEMTYNRQTDVVTVSGNITIWQPSGEVMFAKYVELSRDMRQAFADQAAVILTDNSRFIALETERTEGRYVRMNKAIYSACAPCREHPEEPLLWQIKAERIVHDNEAHEVTYRNATMELAGVPVFYTPYLSHPDPTVKRRTGLLPPTVGARTNLGFTVRSQYFLDIAPDRDATIETSYSADRGALLGGQYRQRFANGRVQLDVSGTVDDQPNDNTDLADESNQFRGHFFLNADFDINQNWRVGADIKRTTDDTYLDLWSYDEDDTLTSRAYLERFSERSYAVLDAYSFQDLRSGITESEPFVVPHVAYRSQSTPQSLWGGRMSFGAETRSITRSSGADSSRASVDIGWRRDVYTPFGMVLTGETTARTDAFYSNDLPSGNDDAGTVRPFAQAQITARLPMVKAVETGQYFLEPISQITVAPHVAKSDPDIANEDSQSLEFDFSNLFEANRFSGVDEMDGGSRVAYGVKGGWAGNSGLGVQVNVGQAMAFEDDTGFAAGSGLEDRFSDFVGQVSVNLPPYADISYNTRLDHSTLDPREHDVRAIVGNQKHKLMVGYFYADQADSATTTTSLREELTVGTSISLTNRWNFSASHRHNLQTVGPIDTDVALTYQDECLTFSLVGERDHETRAGLESGDSVFFRIGFKNLGEFESPSFSPSFLSSSSESN